MKVNEMTGLCSLRLQVKKIVFVRLHDMRNTSIHMDAILCKLVNLLWVVGHQLDGLNLKRHQHMCRNGVIAFIIAKTKRKVRLHRIETLILQAVGANFVNETDASPFLTQI